MEYGDFGLRSRGGVIEYFGSFCGRKYLYLIVVKGLVVYERREGIVFLFVVGWNILSRLLSL